MQWNSGLPVIPSNTSGASQTYDAKDQADKLLVNSEFTAKVFADNFRNLTLPMEVLYPAIKLDSYDTRSLPNAHLDTLYILFQAFILQVTD